MIAASLVAMGSSWKATFDECAKTEADLRNEYGALCWEIYAREARVALNVAQSKTITDLKARLNEPYYANAKYKDQSLIELRAQFAINQDRLRITEGNELYRKEFKEAGERIQQLPKFAGLKDIVNGIVPNGASDNDLPNMLNIMWAVDYLDALSLFLYPLRVTYDETCTFKNVTYNWLDLNRLVYHGTLRTFLDFEKKRIEWLKTHPETR